MKDKGTQLSNYKLPIHTQESTRKGFKGTKKKQWYSLAELQSGDLSGTTDTDSKTDNTDNYKGYTGIYKKHG